MDRSCRDERAKTPFSPELVKYFLKIVVERIGALG